MAIKSKCWKISKDAKAGLTVSQDTAILAGTDKNFIAIGPTGTTIAGPLNIMTGSDNIRTGGLFVQMNDFVKMIPGTIVTPIPQNIPFPPVALFAFVALSMPGLLALLK